MTQIEKALTLSDNPHMVQSRQIYADLPENWKLAANYLYQRILIVGIRGMKEVSGAELAVKLADWCMENYKCRSRTK